MGAFYAAVRSKPSGDRSTYQSRTYRLRGIGACGVRGRSLLARNHYFRVVWGDSFEPEVWANPA
jgi:hypothetical protein